MTPAPATAAAPWRTGGMKYPLLLMWLIKHLVILVDALEIMFNISVLVNYLAM
jgi:hypothetical protein